MKPSKKLYDFLLSRGYTEAYTSKNPKEIWFWKSSKFSLCEKNLNKMGMTAWVILTTWVDLHGLSNLTTWVVGFFLKINKNIFNLRKKIPIFFIPQRSLICHKPNLFRRCCDFLIGQTTTLDLHWKVSHYLSMTYLTKIKL